MTRAVHYFFFVFPAPMHFSPRKRGQSTAVVRLTPFFPGRSAAWWNWTSVEEGKRFD